MGGSWPHTLQEQRQEGNEEHDEDTDDATTNPIEDGCQVVAAVKSTNELSSGSVLTNQQLLVQSSKEHH